MEPTLNRSSLPTSDGGKPSSDNRSHPVQSLGAAGFFCIHVAGGLIHLLLLIAVIVIIVNFVRGRWSDI